MKIRVLGASGSEEPGYRSPAFLVDGFLLMDAGTVSLSLESEEQCRITHIFLTHAHLDHIKGIPFLVDNIVSSGQGCRLSILSGKDVIADLKRNIFNNRIWPDFSTIPDAENPVMRYREISTRGRIQVGDYSIYATRVNHAVPTYGYMIENRSSTALVYTGDTGPTERIWKRMRGHRVSALIAEVSFPDELEELALASGHLTPSLLETEITKMPVIPQTIYVTHLKPFHKATIKKQLARIKKTRIEILRDGMVITV